MGFILDSRAQVYTVAIMERIIRQLSLIIALMLLIPTAAYSDNSYIPQPFTANYSVQLSGFKIGELTRKLYRQEDGLYVLENYTYTTGVVAWFKKDQALERSTWRYQGQTMIPVNYYAHYTGRAKDVVERLDFDWTRNIVTSLRDGKITELPVAIGTPDKLGHQILLRGDVARGMKHIEYQVADRSAIKPYVYDVIGSEELVTARGKVTTIRVQKGTTTFWLAPEWDYLLVQLVQKNKDGIFALYLQKQ